MTEYLRYPNYATNPVDSEEILDGAIANADLATGVGGIYKSSGTVPGNVEATLESAGSLEFNNSSAQTLLLSTTTQVLYLFPQ